MKLSSVFTQPLKFSLGSTYSWLEQGAKTTFFAIGGLLVIVLAGATSQVSPIVRGTSRVSLIPEPPPSFLASLSSISASASIEVLPTITSMGTQENEIPPTLNTKITIQKGMRIFLFGDSMVHAGLSSRFGTLARKHGASIDTNAWISSSTLMWATSDRLNGLLSNYKPDVVFIALGSNEVMLGKPESRAVHIQKIVQQLKGRSCVWIGPPIWKHETGIVSVLRKNASPCLFVDSSQYSIERQSDGIHPNTRGGTDWANQVWQTVVEPSHLEH